MFIWLWTLLSISLSLSLSLCAWLELCFNVCLGVCLIAIEMLLQYKYIYHTDSGHRDGLHEFSLLSLNMSFTSASLSISVLISLYTHCFFCSQWPQCPYYSDFQPGFLQWNELVSMFCLPIPGKETIICNMICPTGSKRPSLLQQIGGDGAVYSTEVASLRRCSQRQQNWPPYWWKCFYFTYVYNIYVY